MTVPGKRKSRSSNRRGRSHLAMRGIKLIKRDNELVRPHHVSPISGMYGGRQVLKVKSKKKKKKEHSHR